MLLLQQIFGLVLLSIVVFLPLARADEGRTSAVGDPGMRRDGLRVAIEAWNQCNEVGEEAPNMGSPRKADCFDIINSTNSMRLVHRVSEEDNALGINASLGGGGTRDVNAYAAWKEIYLGQKCQVQDQPKPWQFWMIMLKSGNMDTLSAVCPQNGKKSQPFPPESGFPCFGQGCMNMPKMNHNYTTLQEHHDDDATTKVLKGSFYGTWDLTSDVKTALIENDTSYYQVDWEKEIEKGSWRFHHVLKTSSKYPWLMLYLRSDATTGYSGGYHYQTRGMLKMVKIHCKKIDYRQRNISIVFRTKVWYSNRQTGNVGVRTNIPKSPDFKVRFTLDIRRGGGSRSQFYLMDIGSCWKNNGDRCNGEVTTDVTRYSEMILNPTIDSWCNPNSLWSCPPYHTFPNGTRVHRSDEENFPYEAYHVYCSPGNAEFPEEPHSFCDPYSNPQPQEIVQILPHPVWGEYGYPTTKGEGWIGDSRTWELDVGRLSQNLYFYQDPGTPAAERYWPSIDIGTEIYMAQKQIAEWTVSDFDITVPDNNHKRA